MSSHPLNIEFHTLGNFQIRTLDESESEKIAQQLCCIDPWRTLGYSSARLRNYLLSTDPCLRCRIIVTNSTDIANSQRAAGVFCVRFPWLLGAYLELFAIFPDYQKLGLGSEVLAWMEQRVAADTRNLWLMVSSFNNPAMAFYGKQGYQIIGKIDNLIKEGYDEMLLRKRLSTPTF
ncbi:N-acetyltransferase domain-containing protein [Gammaproteobacteria bacterium]